MSDTPKAFAIDAGEGAMVHVDDSSDDEEFVLAVHVGGGEVERHEGVTSESVVGLDSEHFTAPHIDPPVPEAADDAE